jgi:hypothetical protein
MNKVEIFYIYQKEPSMKTIPQILLILQILAQTTAFAQPIWNGKTDIAWYNKSQTEFTITTPEQLSGLAKLVNEGKDFKDKTVKLRANIMLNDTANWQNSWIPIGLHDKPFSGTFDGGSFVVKGVYINNPNKNLQGLFGHVDSSGTVKNLGTAAYYIAGLDGVGGLAALNFGTIINSYSDGTVIGDENVGGLVGDNYAGKIINNYSAGTVNGGKNVGGLVGIDASIKSGSFMRGYKIDMVKEIKDSIRKIQMLKNKGREAVQIVGFHYESDVKKYSIINNNYSTAQVAGYGNVGGLVGYSHFDNRITDNYYDYEASGLKEGIGSQDLEIYGASGTDPRNVEGKTTAQMQSKEFAEKLNFLASFFSMNVWVYSPGGYPVLSDKVANMDSYFASGNGTEENPYVISAKKHLENLSFLVNGGAHFSDKHIKLVNNITLNDTSNWRNWASKPPANKWTAIGTERYPFMGTFDGKGFAVSGVYINNSENDQGLFGFVKRSNKILEGPPIGGIKNLGVIASYIKGKNNVGGLAGENVSAAISSCYSMASVTGEEYVGGLVGYNFFHDVVNSYSTGRVTGKEYINGEYVGDLYAGGLIGAGDFMNGNYYDKQTSGRNDSTGSEGKTTAQMQSKEFVDDLNFMAGILSLNSWVYSAGKYPVLSDKAAARISVESYFASGEGTKANPYVISTKKHLENFSFLVNRGVHFYKKHIKLGNHIALNDTANWRNWASEPPANEWTPIGANYYRSFLGTFDGNDFVISGIYINNSSDNQGLFGYNIGEIKNLGVVASYIKGNNNVGGIAGNCSGEIGGSYFVGAVNGEQGIGGLAGRNRGSIYGSYSIGTVAGKQSVGGLAGFNEKDVAKTYSASVVTGEKDAGGLIGYNFPKAWIRDSYYDKKISGQNDSIPKSYYGRTTSEMKRKETYKDWDFKYIWGISGEVNGGYPYLLNYNKSLP